MPQRQTIQTAVATIVVVWTLAVVIEHGVMTGRWLATVFQAGLLFLVTGALAWAGATTDNLIDEVIGKGRGGDGDGGMGRPRTWRVTVPVRERDEDGRDA